MSSDAHGHSPYCLPGVEANAATRRGYKARLDQGLPQEGRSVTLGVMGRVVRLVGVVPQLQAAARRQRRQARNATPRRQSALHHGGGAWLRQEEGLPAGFCYFARHGRHGGSSARVPARRSWVPRPTRQESRSRCSRAPSTTARARARTTAWVCPRTRPQSSCASCRGPTHAPSPGRNGFSETTRASFCCASTGRCGTSTARKHCSWLAHQGCAAMVHQAWASTAETTKRVQRPAADPEAPRRTLRDAAARSGSGVRSLARLVERTWRAGRIRRGGVHGKEQRQRAAT